MRYYWQGPSMMKPFAIGCVSRPQRSSATPTERPLAYTAPGASPSWTETTCIGSSSPVYGGWDSLARRPLPVRSVLPPGSVLFCEILNTGPRALRGDGCRRRRRGAYRFAHGVRLRPRGRRRLARCRRLIQRHGDFQIPSACLGSVSGPRGYRRPRLARDRAHALLCVRICGGL